MSSKRSLLIFLGNLLLFAVLAAAGWLLYSKINSESLQTASASAHIALLQEKERDFDESSANIGKYRDKIEKLKSAFLTEPTFVEFLKMMEVLAKVARVEFKAVNAALPTGTSDKAVFTFSLAGNEQSLVRFFILLDHVPYSGIVGNMNWVRQGKLSDDIKVTADYTIFNFSK